MIIKNYGFVVNTFVFSAKYTDVGKLENIEVHLIEQVKEGDYDVEDKLWCREKYWQAQLFTLSHGMNSTWDWYNTKKKGYRRKKKQNYI